MIERTRGSVNGRASAETRIRELPADQLSQSWRLMQPSLPMLFTTENADGTFNAAPFSWVKPTSQSPPMITASLLRAPRRQRSLENIERNRQFVISVPGLDMAETVAVCGQKVPEDVSKLQVARLATAPSTRATPPRVAGARAYLECEATQLVDTGDHCLVIAKVIAGAYDETLFTPSLVLRSDRSMPCVHLEQYNRADSQVHLFLECSAIRLVEAPYLVPIAELQAGHDTF